jgi:hypothetical protein
MSRWNPERTSVEQLYSVHIGYDSLIQFILVTYTEYTSDLVFTASLVLSTGYQGYHLQLVRSLAKREFTNDRKRRQC